MKSKEKFQFGFEKLEVGQNARTFACEVYKTIQRINESTTI